MFTASPTGSSIDPQDSDAIPDGLVENPEENAPLPRVDADSHGEQGTDTTTNQGTKPPREATPRRRNRRRAKVRAGGARTSTQDKHILQIKLRPAEKAAVDKAAESAWLPRATWARQILLRGAGLGGATVDPGESGNQRIQGVSRGGGGRGGRSLKNGKNGKNGKNDQRGRRR